jgi:hypothetical protein
MNNQKETPAALRGHDRHLKEGKVPTDLGRIWGGFHALTSLVFHSQGQDRCK